MGDGQGRQLHLAGAHRHCRECRSAAYQQYIADREARIAEYNRWQAERRAAQPAITKGRNGRLYTTNSNGESIQIDGATAQYLRANPHDRNGRQSPGRRVLRSITSRAPWCAGTRIHRRYPTSLSRGPCRSTSRTSWRSRFRPPPTCNTGCSSARSKTRTEGFSKKHLQHRISRVDSAASWAIPLAGGAVGRVGCWSPASLYVAHGRNAWAEQQSFVRNRLVMMGKPVIWS